MVMTVNGPVRIASSRSDIIILSAQIITLPEKAPIPGRRDVALRRALVAQMDITRDGFIIRSGEVDEDGYGSTYEEAYTDFLTSLRDRYDSLTRREERLSPPDRSVLERLRSLMGPTQGLIISASGVE